MRLQELFLKETTEEDRAIVSLSSSVYALMRNYKDEEGDDPITLGKVGDLFNTPLEVLNTVTLELQSDKGLVNRQREEDGEEALKTADDMSTMGLWYPDSQTLVINKDYLSTQMIRTIISHELRHALDDYKSDFQAIKPGGKYTAPNKKLIKKSPDLEDGDYLTQTAEINARFLQVLDRMVRAIRYAYKNLDDNEVKPFIMDYFRKAMNTYQITALFPQKEKSKQYKRLMKRAMDFIQKETEHVKSTLRK